MTRFAPMPAPPYYTVIFVNQQSDTPEGYLEMATKMQAEAKTVDGYIGIESTRDADGFGITVSYWRDEAAILQWKQNTKHLLAQKIGRERWYDYFILRVAKVERHYDGP